MKIYTKSGDKLTTSTKIGRVYKNDLIIEVEGTLDEAETTISLAKTQVKNEEVKTILGDLVNELFSFGGDLIGYSVDKINSENVNKLEQLIDFYQEKLDKVNDFVTPGKSQEGAFIHLARVTVRRLERRVVAYARENEVREELLQYINRLSDLLFTLARWVDLNA